jgi:hypothetical protein
MGVELTARSKEELIGSGAQQSINVETALAKGITAQRSGTVVEALNYYYNAASYNSGAPEVSSRLASLQTSVKSGNLREDARNEIQQRNAWIALLKECEDFYKVETRKYPVEIVYDPAIYPVSQINFKTETQDFATNIELRPTREAQSMLQVVQNLRSGLQALGADKLNAWSSDGYSFRRWPDDNTDWTDYYKKKEPYFFANLGDSVRTYRNVIAVQASLINENGKVLGTDLVWLGYGVDVSPAYQIAMTFSGGSFDKGTGFHNSRNVHASAGFKFPKVAVNDITDRVTVKITHVAIDNGVMLNSGSSGWEIHKVSDLRPADWKVIDAETAGKTGLIQISTGTVSRSSYERKITADTDTERKQ